MRRGNTWVPVQRLDVQRPGGWKGIWAAAQDPADPFFHLGAAADLNVEDHGGRAMIGGEWFPMALRLRHDNLTELGTDRREWDSKMAATRRIVLADAA